MTYVYAYKFRINYYFVVLFFTVTERNFIYFNSRQIDTYYIYYTYYMFLASFTHCTFRITYCILRTYYTLRIYILHIN